MKTVYRILFGFHVFVGIGAMAGGLSAILNPEKPLGMPAETLKNSPFSNFLIPGIILFTVIGLGNVFSAVTMRYKSRLQGYISSVFGWALVIWIIVQCIMLLNIHFLHIIFFTVGLIEVVLAAVILFKQGLFPANIVVHLYKNMKKEA